MTEVELQNFRQLAKAAIRAKMQKETHFNVCPLQSLAIPYGSDPVYNVLNTLHCINWDDMQPALKDYVFKAVEELYDKYWNPENAK